MNAFLVRAELPTFFINARKAKLLQELKDSALLYFCGGGYLTGKTLSRLWDGILLCRLSYVFKTPVVMSGQTVGVWNGRFNQTLARWGFKHVNMITVRDKEFSIQDLKEIGLQGENIFYTHDDALFCEKAQDKFYGFEYVTVNFHYWGMSVNEKQINIDKIHEMAEYFFKTTNMKLIFIPMVWTDKESYDDYIQKYPNDRFLCFDYDYDFRKVRKVIADSQFCLTMKHHPIIFAMGEDVPIISLAFSDYYMHKNLGALQQYNQEEFSINLEDPDYMVKFKQKLDTILHQKESVLEAIKQAKSDLIDRKNLFIEKVKELI